MANEKISAFSTISTISGGPIQIKEVEGIAAYCDDPNNPGTKVNVSFSGSDIEDLYLQDLSSVLDQGNQSPNGGQIQMLDAGGFNPLTLSQTGLAASPSSNIAFTGSGFISMVTSGQAGGISLSTAFSGGAANIIITAGSTAGRLELRSEGLLRFNFGSPTVNQILKTLNTSGDMGWVDLPVGFTSMLDAVVNPNTSNNANPAISLDDGNAGTYNVILTGGNGINVDRVDDENITIASSGLAGVLTASSSANSGQSITFTDGTNINVLSVTGFNSASAAALEVKSSGANVEVNSVSNDVILKGGGDLILENTGLGTPTSGDYLVADGATGKAKWLTDPKAFVTLGNNTWVIRDGYNAIWNIGAGSLTLAITASDGDSGTLIVINNGGEITWPTNSNWPDATEPTLTTTGTDVFSFIYDGTNYYWSFGQNFGA